MHFTTLAFTTLMAFATALPSTPLEARQPGGVYVSVGNKYSGGGCNDGGLIFADPIFGNGNVCQPLKRQANGTPVISYKTLSNSAGCSVTLYTDLECKSPGFSAPVGACVQAGSQFLSTFVTCV